MTLLNWIKDNADLALGILIFSTGSIVLIIEAIGRAARRRNKR